MKVDRSVIVSGALGAVLIGIIIYMMRRRTKEDAQQDEDAHEDAHEDAYEDAYEDYTREDIIADEQYQDQLRRGVGVEREHAATYAFIKRYHDQTGGWPEPDKVYAEIAKDHLAELGDYYDRLEEMEKDAGVEAGYGHQYRSPISKIKGGVSLSKDQAKELMALVKGVPKPKGWDSYYAREIKGKLTKVMKALAVAGAVVNPVMLSALLGSKTATFVAKSKRLPGKQGRRKRFEKFADLDKKAIAGINKITQEVMGRAITMMKIYLVNDKDMKKTLADVRAKEYHADPDRIKAPKVSIDWDKVDADKLFAAAMFIADDTANVGTAGGTAAVAPTGAGAAVGGGITAGVATITVGDDIYALKLIADAIGPAIELSN